MTYFQLISLWIGIIVIMKAIDKATEKQLNIGIMITTPILIILACILTYFIIK